MKTKTSVDLGERKLWVNPAVTLERQTSVDLGERKLWKPKSEERQQSVDRQICDIWVAKLMQVSAFEAIKA